MGLKVPVVTTSTRFAVSFTPCSRAIRTTSSAVSTTAVPDFIFSLISCIVFKTVSSAYKVESLFLYRTTETNMCQYIFQEPGGSSRCRGRLQRS